MQWLPSGSWSSREELGWRCGSQGTGSSCEMQAWQALYCAALRCAVLTGGGVKPSIRQVTDAAAAAAGGGAARGSPLGSATSPITLPEARRRRAMRPEWDLQGNPGAAQDSLEIRWRSHTCGCGILSGRGLPGATVSAWRAGSSAAAGRGRQHPLLAPPPSALPPQKQSAPLHSAQGPALPWIQSASPTWSQSVAPPGDSRQPGANPAPPRHPPLPLLPPPLLLLPLPPPLPAVHAALPGAPAGREAGAWFIANRIGLR